MQLPVALEFPGGMELVIIFLVILLVFGAKRIPEIAQGLGKGIREFKDATNDIKREMTTPAPPPAADHRAGERPAAELRPADAGLGARRDDGAGSADAARPAGRRPVRALPQS